MTEKGFVMFEEDQAAAPAPPKPAGEEEHEDHEEHQETPPEEERPEEGSETGKEKEEKPAAQPKPKPPQDQPLPDDPAELKRMLGRQRRAHQRDLEIAELRGRNKALEELVARGVKVPGAAGDGKPGDRPAGDQGDGFVFTKPRPSRDTFEGSETEYEDAVLDWREERREAQRQHNARQTQQAEAKRRGDELYEKVHADTIARIPDYDEKIAESKERGIVVTKRVAQAVAQLGGRYMPDIIYHFATNPEEVKKVNALEDPIGAIEDLRDSFALKARGNGTRRQTPPPPPELGGGGSGVAGGVDEFDPKLSTEARIAAGKARREREAGAGKK